MRSCGVLAMSLAFGVVGCDAVRVDREPKIEVDAAPAGVVLAAAAPGFGETRLERTLEESLGGGRIVGEAIDVAARATGGLEAAACREGSSQAAPDCEDVDVELDAAVMDAAGRFGAVVAVTRAAQPAMLARSVAETTFLALIGDGAQQLVSASGSDGPHVNPRRKPPVAMKRAGGLGGFALVVRLADGQFAAAASSAGSLRMPRGRLMAVGIEGAAIYAGGHGAVAINGDTAHLLRTLLAKAVYHRMAAGEGVRDAITWAIATAPARAAIAIVAIDDAEHHAASNRGLDSATLSLAGHGAERDDE